MNTYVPDWELPKRKRTKKRAPKVYHRGAYLVSELLTQALMEPRRDKDLRLLMKGDLEGLSLAEQRSIEWLLDQLRRKRLYPINVWMAGLIETLEMLRK